MSDGLFGKSGGGLTGGLPSGLKLAAIALLIQQMMKHTRSTEAAAPEAPPSQASPQGGGGLGDILGGLLGGGAGQSGGGILGGLGGLLGGLRSQGLDHKVDSWVRPGPNQSVTASELERAFGPQDLDAAARHAGTDRDSLLQEVSRVLPDLVDRMTPGGRLPERETDLGNGGLGGLLRGLFGDRGSPDNRH